MGKGLGGGGSVVCRLNRKVLNEGKHATAIDKHNLRAACHKGNQELNFLGSLC